MKIERGKEQGNGNVRKMSLVKYYNDNVNSLIGVCGVMPVCFAT